MKTRTLVSLRVSGVLVVGAMVVMGLWGIGMMIRSLGASEPIALADSYAIDLHTGHKIAVRYSVAVDAKDRRGIADSYNESEQWVHRVRDRLRDDFGPAVEELWALGTHGYRNIGESARLDHQTRVFKLADLIEQMRRGYLVKR